MPEINCDIICREKEYVRTRGLEGGTREQFLKTCNFRVDYVAFKVLETQYDVICCKKLLQNEDARGQRGGDRGCT